MEGRTTAATAELVRSNTERGAERKHLRCLKPHIYSTCFHQKKMRQRAMEKERKNHEKEEILLKLFI